MAERRTDTGGMLVLSFTELAAFTYHNSTADVPVPPYKHLHIKILKALFVHWQMQGNPVGDDWKSITAEEYDAFHTFPEYQSFLQNGIPAPALPILASRACDMVAKLKKGVKGHVSSAFTALKDMKQWDQYNYSTKVPAHLQGVVEVLDEIYVLQMPKEKELFLTKQEFMYAVFEKTLLTDYSEAVIHMHENGDVQKVFAALQKYAENSTEALINSADLLTCIISVHWDKCNGGDVPFVLH
jgi:hypothetical protein